MTEKEKMLAGELYNANYDENLINERNLAKEKCFALHGGTAINLFIRNMPRLSVDIDLTYLPIEDRETSLKQTTAALQRISPTTARRSFSRNGRGNRRT